MQYFLVRDGKQSGPYSSEQMKEMISRGEVSANNLVLFESMTAWIPISSVYEFSGLLAQSSAGTVESPQIQQEVISSKSPPNTSSLFSDQASSQVVPRLQAIQGPNEMKGSMLVGGWIWSVFWGLITIAAFKDDGIVAALFTIYIGLIFFPPLMKKIQLKFWQRIVAVFFGLILIGVFFRSSSQNAIERSTVQSAPKATARASGGKSGQQPLQESSEQSEKVSLNKNIGVSYSDMMQGFDGIFDMKKGTDVKGQPRYSGMSHNALATLELIGEKNNLSQVSSTIGFPSDKDKVLIENIAIMFRFFNNAVPRWEGTDWLKQQINDISKGDYSEKITTYNGKQISVIPLGSTGIICFTVKAL